MTILRAGFERWWRSLPRLRREGRVAAPVVGLH